MQAAWLSTQIRKAWGRKFPGLGRDQPDRGVELLVLRVGKDIV